MLEKRLSQLKMLEFASSSQSTAAPETAPLTVVGDLKTARRDPGEQIR